MKELDKLLEIATILLGPEGCPWDREQTYFTLQPFLLEELHEVLEAIDSRDPEKIKEELGDLLYGVIFVAKVAEKEKEFTLADVLSAVAEKLIRRHPHVFGDKTLNSIEELGIVWEEIKKKEKGHEERKSALDGIPESLPLLAKGQKLVHKMRRNKKDFLPFSQEENKESSEAVLGERMVELLYQIDRAGLDAESILRRTLARYEKIFREEELKI